LLDGFYEEEEESETDYAALRVELSERGVEAMYRELQERDPDLAAHTQPHDHHRILRGIAVHRQRQERLSNLQKESASPLSHPFQLYFLHADRKQTYDRVNARVLKMLEDGLIEEVRGLWEYGLDETNCNALRTHGYQEIFPFLRGEITHEQMVEDIQKAVRHYVKRQFTWFRREARAIWIERRYEETSAEVARRIADDFRHAT
jgi:tRNA dimethylallyltransferase